MNEIFIAPFVDHEYMRLALFASILVAITCAIAGTFVVLRGLAFVGDALSHGVLPGIATALIFGVSGIIGAAVGAVVMMSGVNLITRRYKLSGDTAIGLLFVGMLALGVMITSRSSNFEEDLDHILFGETLSVKPNDLLWQSLALVIVLLTGIFARRPFLLMSVDEGLARTSGFNVTLFQNLMLAIVGLTVIASFQTVGTLLVLGMLIAPAATGVLFARRISSMMIIASIIGCIASYTGLLISFHFELTASASIVLVAVSIFAIGAIATEIKRNRNSLQDEMPHQHEHNHAH